MRYPLFTILLLLHIIGYSQEFQRSQELEPTQAGELKFADLDNDTDQDLIYNGINASNKTKVYENQGGTFVDRHADLPGFWAGDFDLGDFDNDGDLDVLMGGAQNDRAQFIALYRNNGNFQFELVREFTGLGNTALAFADIDRDLDLDIYTSGQVDLMNEYVIVYRNDGGDNFQNIGTAGLPVCFQCSMDWKDLNNDTFVDVALTGLTSVSSNMSSSKIYFNNKNSTFSDAAAGLRTLFNGGLAFGDYDDDGDFDLVQSGSESDIYRTIFYENTGSSWIEKPNVFLTPVTENWPGSIRWVDINRDHKVDLIIAGRGGSNIAPQNIFHLFVNTGLKTFEQLLNRNLDDFNVNAVDTVDYDNDGFIDLGFMGFADNEFKVMLLHNGVDEPTNASATIKDAANVQLTWTDNSVVESNFIVQRSEGTNTNYSTIKTTGQNTITATDTYTFKPDTWYYYSIFAKDEFRQSKTATCKVIIPTKITSLQTTTLNAKRIRLNWNDQSTTEKNYAVMRRLSTGGTFEQIALLAANTTSYLADNLLENKSYDFAIKSVNEYGSPGIGNISTAKTNARPAARDIFVEVKGKKMLEIPSAEFVSVFNDLDPSDELKFVIIQSKTLSGDLTLNGLPVSVPQKIAKADLDKLGYEPVKNMWGSEKISFRVHDGADSSNLSYAINIEIIMGMEEMKSNPHIQVKPNPASSYIVLQVPNDLQDSDVKLVDMNQRTIYRETQHALVQEHDVKSIASGLYFLIVTDKRGHRYFSRVLISK